MLKYDKSGIIYCEDKMCEQTDCFRNQIHQIVDGETIYKMDKFAQLNKNGNCKNKKNDDTSEYEW